MTYEPAFRRKRLIPRAAQLKGWWRQDRIWDYSQVYSELDEAAQNSAVEGVLELAKKYPEMRREVYWRAFSKVLTAGDVDRARRIANEYDVDPETQRLMLAKSKRRKNGLR